MKVGFVIPVYKNPEQLNKCLKAIRELKTNHEISVFQHDNSDENIGFTKAVNKGLVKYIEERQDFCVVLNQDCYVKPDFLDSIVDFMIKHPKCVISGPKQLSDKDEDFIIHGGCTTAYPEGRHIVGRISAGNCSVNKKMPWVNGACMVVNMSLLPQIGVMDDNFFLIGSDSDWCYHARLRGFEVWYVADASVVHEKGVSTKTASMKLEYAKYLDMMFFRDKWQTDGALRELQMEVFG